jgi:cell division protease FtsH
MKRHIKSIVIWAVIVFVTCYAFYNFEENKRLQSMKSEVSYSQFIHTVRDKAVLKVVILDNQIQGLLKSGQKFETINPNDHGLIETLLSNNVEVVAELPKPPSAMSTFFWTFGPILLLVGVWIWFMKKQGPNSQLQFGKSKAKLY